MACSLCLTRELSNQFNFYTMRAFIIAIAMLAATMASAQTNISEWQGRQNYRDISHATVWAGEVQHNGKPLAVSILRNDDMGVLKR